MNVGILELKHEVSKAACHQLIATEGNVLFSQPSFIMKKPDRVMPALLSRRQTDKPAFDKPLHDVWTEVDSKAKFVAEVSCSPPFQISWFFNEQEVRNSNKYRFANRGNRCILVVSNIDQFDEGIFTCCVTNAIGSSSCTAMLAVITPKNPRNIGNPGKITKVTQAAIKEDVASKVQPTRQEKLSDDLTQDMVISPDLDKSIDDYSSATSFSMSDMDGAFEDSPSTKHNRPQQKIKRVRVGKRHSKNFDPAALDWTEEVRKLIREELDAKEKEKQALEFLLQEKSEKSETNKPTSYAPNFVQCISDCKVLIGETAHFVYILTSEPAAEVLWLRNGIPMFLRDSSRPQSEARTATDGNIGFISDDNAGCLVISEADSSHSGIYTCVVSNHCGSTKCSANLTVEDKVKTLSHDFELDGFANESSHSHLVDQESQTFESRVDDEDQMITDAFIELETAEKTQAIPDIVIDDTKSSDESDDVEQSTSREKKQDSLKLPKLGKKSRSVNHGRMDDNETGEGLQEFGTLCTYKMIMHVTDDQALWIEFFRHCILSKT